MSMKTLNINKKAIEQSKNFSWEITTGENIEIYKSLHSI